jgi:hypothetical protein
VVTAWMGTLTMGRPKPSAMFSALSVQVDCPHCGETLPAPDDSLFWTIPELAGRIADRPECTCDSCDESYVLRQQSKAHLPLDAQASLESTACEEGGSHSDPQTEDEGG